MKRITRECRNTWTDTDVEIFWDSVADIYVDENESVQSTHNQRFLCAIPWLKLEPGIRVLNITSRDCAAEEHIKSVCNDIDLVHVEISQRLIEVANIHRPYVNQVKISSYSRLPFKDGEFDRVLTLETLEHVEEPVCFLRELYRVTKQNSIMVLSCPPATCEPAYWFYTKFIGGHGEGPHRFLHSKEVKMMLGEAGWYVTLHKGTLLIPVGPQWLKAWGERIINRFQGGIISELGIRQFYVCQK